MSPTPPIAMLADFLDQHSAAGSPQIKASCAAIHALADAAAQISALIRQPHPTANLGAVKGSANADGDAQKALDVLADEIITAALRTSGVALYLSEEQDAPIPLNDDGLVIIASDPLDGSSNIDTNVSVGTIFSITDVAGGILQKGRDQLAAGFFVYGPQTSLLLTLGDGVFAFQMDDNGAFHAVPWNVPQDTGHDGDRGQVTIPDKGAEFAINASNQRHWEAPIAAYIGDCLAGADGPIGRNFNMRWIGSLVADGWRIFRRGGVFLYPADRRAGYEDGRLRLVYEAAPIALLVEQAGGAATSGNEDILDIMPTNLHQRVSFMFGSKIEVDLIMSYCNVN